MTLNLSAPILEVQDFGPIAQAEVTLRPLTVLIGPNGSGKSYLAKLAYALTVALSTLGRSPSSGRDSWLEQLDDLERALPRLAFRELPVSLQNQYRDAARKAQDDHAGYLRLAMSNYFGFRASDLVNRRGSAQRFSIHFLSSGSAKESVVAEISSEGDEFNAVLSLPPLSRAQLPTALPTFETKGHMDDLAEFLLSRWTWEEFLRLGQINRGSAFYLPSGRSGLVAGAQVVAAAATSLIAGRVGLEPIELAPFMGVEGDFVRALTLGIHDDGLQHRRRGWSEGLASSLDLLERMLEGSVSSTPFGPGRRVLVFEQHGLQLPMERSSSTVAEHAGLALWIEAFLRRGDSLFVDEPEAHLHPENQRLIARVLVRLVNAGVRVVCTTHSSLILHQISNAMLASTRRESHVESFGFTAADLISADDIAVYLFRPGDHGATVSQVEVSPTEGIDEDEFGRVAEAIGDETVDLVLAGNR